MRLRNVFLVCADLARSETFYGELGLPRLKHGKRSVVFDLGGSELHLHAPLTPEESLRYGVKTGTGEGLVICLETSELERHSARLGTAVQETPWGKRMTLVRDPDGRLLELSE